jgi:hypothetical protein
MERNDTEMGRDGDAEIFDFRLQIVDFRILAERCPLIAIGAKVYV